MPTHIKPQNAQSDITSLDVLDSEDRADMLDFLRVKSTEDLFSCIPDRFRLDGPLSLPEALSEWQLQRVMSKRAAQNTNLLDAVSFLGGGVYQHHVPAAIDTIAARGEFLTAYTPYQPEMSQGLLSALDDFSTKVAAFTGLPVVTSSHYDGATALAEACWMAVKATGRKKIAVTPQLFPQYRKILETYSWGRSVEIAEIGLDEGSGRLDVSSVKDPETIAAFVLQNPDAKGLLLDQTAFAAASKTSGAKLIGALHPYLPFHLGEGAVAGYDIITMEGQPLGLHMFAGGAHLGILACKSELKRWTPGRLIGRVNDIYGKPALALVYEDREQHVARERATSNICSNQALNAVRAGAFLSLFGAAGLSRLAGACHANASTLLNHLSMIDLIDVPPETDIFNEFTIRFASEDIRTEVVCCLRKANIFAGVESENYPLLKPHELLVAVTEIHGQEDLKTFVETLCEALGVDAPKSMDFAEGCAGGSAELGALLEHPDLEPIPEIGLIRRYTGYTRENFGVDTGSYPLGSCTMKYNPKRNDAVTEQVGFQALHPFQPKDTLAGLSTIYSELRSYIAEIIGMDCVDLTPAAGAHGELKGLLVARRYFEDIGEHQRDEVIIPDSAHGTNPASATMVGYKCRIVPTRPDGLMDARAFKQALSDRTAVVMTTNPSTFGVFEEEIGDIIEFCHGAGALLYYDGANMNALMGHTSPGRMGFDIAHINLHKTMSTPHGGGGPGAGPIGVRAKLSKYLATGLDRAKADPGLRVKLYYGHISVLLRAYAYIRTMGPNGLKQASADAVLNANYLMRKLQPVIPPVFDRTCMHEALLNGADLPVSTLNLAKRMIDFGVHPPTLVGAGCVYYGESLSQAMLFEPTETETKADIDNLVSIISKIVDEASVDSTIAETAPKSGKTARIII